MTFSFTRGHALPRGSFSIDPVIYIITSWLIQWAIQTLFWYEWCLWELVGMVAHLYYRFQRSIQITYLGCSLRCVRRNFPWECWVTIREVLRVKLELPADSNHNHSHCWMLVSWLTLTPLQNSCYPQVQMRKLRLGGPAISLVQRVVWTRV